jgi:hypothetical protein
MLHSALAIFKSMLYLIRAFNINYMYVQNEAIFVFTWNNMVYQYYIYSDQC